MGWDNFFHARVGPSACVLSGWIRVGFALLVLYDRLLLTIDFDWFFLSGLMPLEVSSKHLPTSILWLSPENPILYWALHIGTIVHALLLLVGILPRLNLVLIYLYSMGFWMHNQRIWDSEDDMFRFWNVFLVFMPLHRVTIYEWWQGHTGKQDAKTPKNDSWPIWPFRLWQIEICAIYICAGFAKLSSPEWQAGNAMLHVVQTVDFYGGVANPDFIFNRMGPLMLMTYASLALESVCVVTAWFWPTLTVLGMVSLHLGIELSMNMHCFEWLCVLGWLTFLVQPIIPEAESEDVAATTQAEGMSAEPEKKKEEEGEDTTESTSTVAGDGTIEPKTSDPGTKVSEGFQKQAELVGKTKSSLLRHVGTGVLVAIASIIAIETVPLDKIKLLLPEAYQAPVESALQKRNAFVQRWTDPITFCSGLRQTGWYMYSRPPWVVFQYEAIISYHNATQGSWTSPSWTSMSWYEKKRWQRPMSFFDRLRESTPLELDAFARYLAKEHGQAEVASVQLIQHMETPETWPWDIKFGFFNEAKQPMVRYETKNIHTLNLCDDFDPRCAEWASEGHCEWPITTEMGECRYSCGFCDATFDKLEPHSRVAIQRSFSQMYYRATVRQTKNYPTPQIEIEYDYYDHEVYRSEWVDAYSMLHRKLIHLTDEEETVEVIVLDDNKTDKDGCTACSPSMRDEL